ncbi:hypothetical protein DPMN_127666 [Dreissena polymorpha]|uniref:Uncharacterized protein n=1 Tax=Dreissena polymorpha TaxID=45954 RepID=A0A9D4JVN6_DREPO|nr:hypothetical protein DPMN_127666 [Dreissena polymorpha]
MGSFVAAWDPANAAEGSRLSGGFQRPAFGRESIACSNIRLSARATVRMRTPFGTASLVTKANRYI